MTKPNLDSTSVNNAAQGQTMLDLALWYASQGVAVFPLLPREKKPLPGSDGFKSATTDETQIRDWWSQWPDANIGGHPSANQVVIDVDVPGHNDNPDSPDGFESLTNYELPETFTCETGSGGAHYWYTLPVDCEEYKTTGTKILPGVDLRGVKGYVVMPGSVNSDGKPYKLYVDGEAVDPRTLDELPALRSISEAPGWLLDLCRGTNTGNGLEGRGEGKKTLAELLANPPKEGERNDWLTKVAGHYANKYANDREKYDHCIADAANKTTPPMDLDEAAKTAESIWNTHQGNLARERTDLTIKGQLTPAPGHWSDVARHLLDQTLARGGVPTIFAAAAGEGGNQAITIWSYQGDRWGVTNKESLKFLIYSTLDRCSYLDPENGNLKRWKVSQRLAGEMALAVMSELARRTKGKRWNGEQQWFPGVDHPEGNAEDYVSVENGLLNLRTRELIPHTPALMNLSTLEVSYNPDAKAECWARFLATAYLPEGRKALQEYAGYVVSGATDRQKLLYLYGQSGTGKTLAINTFAKVLGTSNATTSNQHDLKENFGQQHWIGKKLVVFDDTPSGVFLGYEGVARLKEFTGGANQTINVKHQARYEGQFTARLAIISNEPPAWQGNDRAMVRRLLILQTTGGKVEDLRPNELEAAVVAEREGILNWALDGLDRLREQGDFSEPETQAEDVENMMEAIPTLEQFLEENLVRVANTEVKVKPVPIKEIIANFKTWWIEEGGVGRVPANRAKIKQAVNTQFSERGWVKRAGGRKERTSDEHLHLEPGWIYNPIIRSGQPNINH